MWAFNNPLENNPSTEENVINTKKVLKIGKSLETDPLVWFSWTWIHLKYIIIFAEML